MKVAVCVRGHIRDGLTNPLLNDFLVYLKNHNCEIDLFLHTWKESEAKSSYRELIAKKYIYKVPKELLLYYFREHNVKRLEISDDSKIELIGNVEGGVAKSICPLIAWKRMWWGKYRLIQHVYDNYRDEYDKVISIRYDFFNHTLGSMPKQRMHRMLLQSNCINFRYPDFNSRLLGVDNYYCGQLNNIAKLTYDFHYKLDSILEKYSNVSYQEEMVYRYALDNSLDTTKYEDSIYDSRPFA